jgi:hypothetical protein
MIAEYLEHALQFERWRKSKLKADLQKQAATYRKLATERTKKLGMEPPISN